MAIALVNALLVTKDKIAVWAGFAMQVISLVTMEVLLLDAFLIVDVTVMTQDMKEGIVTLFHAKHA